MRLHHTLLATAVIVLATMPARAEELTGTLKKINDSGMIAVAYRASAVPFSFLDDTQKPVGFAMDICARIVDAVKTELKMPDLAVKYVPVTLATRIPLVANGAVDLECESTTNSAAREKQVAFTNTHFLTASRFIFKKSSHINSIQDLAGKPVVSTSGTTNIEQLNHVNHDKKLGMKILPVADNDEAFLDVQTDRAVAFAMDDILLDGYRATAKDSDDYVISDFALSKPGPYGIMMRRDDPAFKALADKTTAALYESPEIMLIYDKWFTKPINKQGLNLAFPIPADLKKAFVSPSDSPDPDAY